jgi:hypothetical protein
VPRRGPAIHGSMRRLAYDRELGLRQMISNEADAYREANPEWPMADHTPERPDIVEGQILRPGDGVIMAGACCQNFPLDSPEGGEAKGFSSSLAT